MKKRSKSPLTNLIATILTFVLAAFWAGTAHAVPYASCITNDFANSAVYYYLNEDADNVQFVTGGVTNDLGFQSKGLHNVFIAGAASYDFYVTKSQTVQWRRIADDALGGTNANKFIRFFSPGGIAPNRNPKNLSHFGRVYVVENAGGATSTTGTARTDSKGVYILNADQSDALGRGDASSSGGIVWTAGTASTSDGIKSPWKVEVGEDDYVYISDFSTNHGGVFRVDADVLTGEEVLATPGRNTNPSVHTDSNGSALTKGSIADGNLQLWSIDGAWPSGGFNRILRYDIGAGPLPWNNPPSAILRTAGVPSVADVQADLDIAPDGKFFVSQNRGLAAAPYSADAVNVRVLDTDGLTVLWDSLAQTTNILGVTSALDIFTNAYAIKVSPDGGTVAIIRLDLQTWVMKLTNGIPDIGSRQLINTFNGTALGAGNARRREVAFDAAGNLYAGNNSVERMVIWSPGGGTTAKTTYNNGTGQGSFQMFVAPNAVSVTNTIPTTSEAGSPGQFTILRTGDTSAALTVNYSVTGTADSGSDYTSIGTSVTFQPGASATNITVAALTDGDAEFTETVILTIGAGGGYAPGTPAVATVSILDTATPEISVLGEATAARTNLLEGFADSQAVFPISRKGSLAAATTVTVSYGGAAGLGTDFNGPTSITFAAGAVTTNLILTPITDINVESPKAFTVTVNAGGYNIGTPIAGGMVYSEDISTAGAVTVFGDAFNTDTSPNWQVNKSADGDSDALFAYDYSALSIPEAPHSAGAFAAQRGLRLRSHLTAAVTTNGLSVSPIGVGVTGDYRFRFDMWMNYNGPLDAGGAGSTEHFSAGIGTDGTRAIWPGNPASDGIWFTAAPDGGVLDTSTTQGDVGAFAGSVLLSVNFNYYAAGLDPSARGNANVYYNVFGGSAAQAGQIVSVPAQTNRVSIGGFGMAWHAVVIAKIGDNVTWDVDGYRIATLPASVTTLSTNVFLGFHDWFASANGNSAVEFALYDNVLVEVFPPVITSIQLINGGADVQITFTASTADTDASFTLESSGSAGSGYTNTGATVTTLGPGQFQVTLPVSGSARFYRVHRL